MFDCYRNRSPLTLQLFRRIRYTIIIAHWRAKPSKYISVPHLPPVIPLELPKFNSLNAYAVPNAHILYDLRMVKYWFSATALFAHPARHSYLLLSYMICV